MLGHLLGVAVDQLNTDLLGELELNLLAVGLGELGHTLLDGLGVILNLGLSNALLLGDDLARDSGKGDGLVDAGLDGLGVTDTDIDIDRGDNGDIVGSLLGDLLAVLVSISMVSMAIAGLADSHHLDISLLLEGNLNGLGSGVLVLLVVVVAADLIVDGLNGLSADSAGNIVAVLSINNPLDGQLNILTDGLESGGADLSLLGDVLDSAVVTGLLIAIMGLVVGGGRVVVGRGGVVGSGLVGGLSGLVGGLSGLVGRLSGLVGGLGLAVVVDGLLGMAVAVAVAIGLAVVGEGGVGAGAGLGHSEGEEGGEGNEGLKGFNGQLGKKGKDTEGIKNSKMKTLFFVGNTCKHLTFIFEQF